jgi:hypothetical protein
VGCGVGDGRVEVGTAGSAIGSRVGDAVTIIGNGPGVGRIESGNILFI